MINRLRTSTHSRQVDASKKLAAVSFRNVVIFYLLGLTLAEAVTTLSEARLGMILHGLLLLAVFVLASLYHDGPQASFLYIMALGPLIRLTSLSLPLPRFDFIYWYALVGLPLILAAFAAMRANHLTAADVGLSLRRPFMQLLIALCGIGLGAMEYLILRPDPLVEQLTFEQVIVPALILLIFTGFLEELIFRGLMQHTGFQNFGWLGGILYVSVVFAVLHIGYRSILDVLFVFGVAVFFAIMAKTTGSIVGVTIAHGLTNIGLFLIFPFLIGSQLLSNPLPKIPRYVNSLGVVSKVVKDPILPAELAVGQQQPSPVSSPFSAAAWTPTPTSSPTLVASPTASPTLAASPVAPQASPTPAPEISPSSTPGPTADPASSLPALVQTVVPLPQASPTLLAAAAIPLQPTSQPARPTLVPQPPAPFEEMIFVPGGLFRMGCDEDNRHESCHPDEAPLHSVSLFDYRIDRTEVTTAQYAACVAAGACNPPLTSSSITRPDYYNNPDYASYPVINVTWQDAAAYCLWAGKRLPSEAEWEKAARLSKLAPLYPWGDKATTCDLANYQSPEGPCIGDTTPVDSYPQGLSPVGVADLAGNVAEWVNDWYLAGYYFASPASNPTGPRSGDLRVVRGGSWNSNWEDIRTARRNSLFPNVASLEIGFRCAWTP